MTIAHIGTEKDFTGSTKTASPAWHASTADNDFALATYGNGDDLADPVTSSGMTVIASEGDITGGDRTIAALRKFASSESGTQAIVGDSGSSSNQTVGMLSIFRGVHLTTPMDVAYAVGDHFHVELNEVAPTPDPITTLNDGAMVVCVVHCKNNTVTAIVPPSGYTLAAQNIEDSRHFGVAYKIKATAGLESPGAWGLTGAAGTEDPACFTFALRPAASEKTITDTLASTDAQAPLRERNRAANDAIAAADAIDPQRFRKRVLADSIAVADSVAIGAQTSSETLSDSLAANDATDIQRERNRVQSDSLTATDSALGGAIRPRSVSDSLEAADVSVGTRERNRVLADAISVTDSVTVTAAGAINSVTVSDSLEVADAVVSLRQRTRKAIHSFDVADGVSAWANKPRTLTESADVVDASQLSRIRTKIAADAFDVADDITATFVTSLNEVTVTETIDVTDNIVAQRIKGAFEFVIRHDVDQFAMTHDIENRHIVTRLRQET